MYVIHPFHRIIFQLTGMLSVISQLADLFWQLEYCETAAVTPTIELAKLALVTSRDEEEDEADKGGTDSSNDTDATLVDDAPPRVLPSDQPSESPTRSPGSVLGKRPRDVDRQRSEMSVDSTATDDFVMVSSPGQSTTPPSKGVASSSKSREMSICRDDADGDVEMCSVPRSPEERSTQKRPPLPPRKTAEVSDSVMMFGKIPPDAMYPLSDNSS
jgi:ubiquitin carboxyl-terminal hydrolase 25/28